jgi:hypothetical protein
VTKDQLLLGSSGGKGEQRIKPYVEKKEFVFMTDTEIEKSLDEEYQKKIK